MWRWNSFQSRMRSIAERSRGSSLRYSMKPVGLPIVGRGQLVRDWKPGSGFALAAANSGDIPGIGFEGGHHGFLTAKTRILNVLHRLQHSLVIFGHHFDELGSVVLPISKNCRRPRASGIGLVTLNHFPDLLNFIGPLQLLEPDHLQIALARKLTSFVEHISNATGHPGSEIPPGSSKDDHTSACHVLATVVANGFNDRGHPAIPHAEAFAGHAADIGFPAGRPVERDIAYDDIVLRDKRGKFRRINDDFTARETFADVIVGVALQEESHAFGHERAKALPRASCEVNLDCVLWHCFSSPAPRDFAADDRADNP